MDNDIREIRQDVAGFLAYLSAFSTTLVKDTAEQACSTLIILLDSLENTEQERQFLTILNRFETKDALMPMVKQALEIGWMSRLSEKKMKTFNQLFPGKLNDPRMHNLMNTVCDRVVSFVKAGNFRSRLADVRASWCSSAARPNTQSPLFALEPGKAIRTAAANGLVKELNVLLLKHAQSTSAIDSNPAKGWTALHWAIDKGHVDCVFNLLLYGARYDVADRSEAKLTPVDIALQKGNRMVINILSQHIVMQHIKQIDDTAEDIIQRIVDSLTHTDPEALKLLRGMNTPLSSSPSL